VAAPQPAPVASKPEVTKQDLLKLKQQVMDEIRKEIEEQTREKFLADQRAHEALLA